MPPRWRLVARRGEISSPSRCATLRARCMTLSEPELTAIARARPEPPDRRGEDQRATSVRAARSLLIAEYRSVVVAVIPARHSGSVENDHAA